MLGSSNGGGGPALWLGLLAGLGTLCYILWSMLSDDEDGDD